MTKDPRTKTWCDADRCLVVFEHDDSVVMSLSLSLQQRIDIRLSREQASEMADWLIDFNPNGLSEPKD